jgi:hypothetical protein
VQRLGLACFAVFYAVPVRDAAIQASFSSENWGEKHRIRIPVAFRLYLVKIIQILTN